MTDEITFNKNFSHDLEIGERAEGRLAQILTAKGNTIEVKSDLRYKDTGNIAVEFEQDDGRGGKKPSGIAATKAEWWAVEYEAGHFVLLPTETVKRLARVQYKAKGAVSTGDNGNRSVLIPLGALINPWMITPHEQGGLFEHEGEAKTSSAHPLTSPEMA